MTAVLSLPRKSALGGAGKAAGGAATSANMSLFSFDPDDPSQLLASAYELPYMRDQHVGAQLKQASPRLASSQKLKKQRQTARNALTKGRGNAVVSAPAAPASVFRGCCPRARTAGGGTRRYSSTVHVCRYILYIYIYIYSTAGLGWAAWGQGWWAATGRVGHGTAADVVACIF